MAREIYTRDTFVTILGSDGTFRERVADGATGPNIQTREIIDKKTGAKSYKTEEVFNKLTGMITGIGFYDGNYGTNIQITVADEGKADVISLPINDPFGEDFMKKFPNVDTSKKVTFAPYCFADKANPENKIKGLTLLQDGVKVDNFFVEKTENPDGTFTYKNLHNYPESKKTKDQIAKMSKPEYDMYWKTFYFEVQLFLMNYIKDNFAHLKRVIEPATKDTTTPVDNSDAEMDELKKDMEQAF